MKVTIFGATGDQGAAQVRALVAAGHDPIAVSRAPAPIEIAGQAIEARAADFADHPSLDAAIAGADAVFLNLPSTSFQAAPPLIAAANVIAKAAQARGVRSLIFNTSMPVPAEPLGFAGQDARHEMRRLVFEAGVPAVSIQPVVFLDNLLKGWAWPEIARNGRLVYPHHAMLKVSWICHDDLAALMIAALDRPELSGRSFAVGGADTVRLPELAAILTRAWSRPLTWESQSIETFCDNMRRVFEKRATLDAESMVGELGRIYRWYNESSTHPFRIDMAPVLRELPVALTPIAAWAARQQLPAS
ncbi:NmrA family NAD(P)-binding protein [Sphingomonas sp. 1P06PA]|uniref:SDR family oxidoreductase n=1 Tax=Sphingomonas sp. 1P06PA TaxID=554121 RepID=UPI0039A545B0